MKGDITGNINPFSNFTDIFIYSTNTISGDLSEFNNTKLNNIIIESQDSQLTGDIANIGGDSTIFFASGTFTWSKRTVSKYMPVFWYNGY